MPIRTHAVATAAYLRANLYDLDAVYVPGAAAILAVDEGADW